MIRLKIPTEPYWLELPFGVRLEVRPASTALLAAARAWAVRKVTALVEDIATRKEAGVSVADLPDLTDPDQRSGFTHFFGIVGVARAALVSWEGVAAAESDALAEITDETVADLMRVSSIGELFYERYFKKLDELVAEGNALRSAPNGTGGADQPIAPDAKAPAPAAPKDTGESTATAVPTSKTIQ